MSKKNEDISQKVRNIALMGMLFALAMICSLIESSISTGLLLPPGVKIGLSNIITMYCLFFLGNKSAYTMAVLKSLFVFITRGGMSGILSLSGGLFSITMMLICIAFKKLKPSYMVISIVGAISHNVAQIVVVSIMTKLGKVGIIANMPILVLSGLIMGILTSFVLNLLIPHIKKIGFDINKNTD